MKMAGQLMSEISGIAIYPIVSLTIFLGFFVGMTIYVLAQRKSKMQEMEHFVLEEQDRWDIDNTPKA